MVSAFELSIDAAAFWQYSIAKYAQTDVKKSTLILQDDYAFNVNLLLFCMLCDNASYRMSPALIAYIMDDIFDSEAVLRQHREKRRQAKPSEQVLSAAYDFLLQQELSLEAEQQAGIVSSFIGYTKQLALSDAQSTPQSNDTESSIVSSSLLEYYAVHTKNTNLMDDRKPQQLIKVLAQHV